MKEELKAGSSITNSKRGRRSVRRGRLLFLADDLTGAMETAAILSQSGQPVRWGTACVPAVENEWVRVVDCQTRRLPVGRAVQRYTRLLKAARVLPGQVYLKLDSTLRGSVVAALRAALAYYDTNSLVFCPSYPAQGRVLVDGQLLVHGKPLSAQTAADISLEPILGGGILDILRPVEEVVVKVRSSRELRNLLGPGPGKRRVVACCDAQTDRDLRRIWSVLEDVGTPVVLAGSTGLLSVRYPRLASAALDPAVLQGRKWLVVCGSMNPVARRQASLSRWSVFEPPSTPRMIVDHLQAHDGVVLATPAQPIVDASSIQTWLMSASSAVLSRHDAAHGVIVFGGDTASSLLRESGAVDLQPAGELLPGVPCCWVTIGNATIPLITKAGGFGPPDLLNLIYREINKS